MDKLYIPIYQRIMVTNQSALDCTMNKIESWEFDTIVPCHGKVVTDSAKYEFTAHVRRGQVTTN
jgi:flavorubredoxin